MYSYTKTSMTIKEFILRYGEIDCQPVGQRLDTETSFESGSRETKAQGIINSILIGIDLGQITVHEVNDGDYVYESIDGGHRKRYIKSYFENKFRVNGKFYRDLSKEEKDHFLNTELSFVIYSKGMNVWDIGHIFRSLNKTTDVNHQEMLNSYGNIPIANAVRNTVRPVHGVNNKFHNLFEFSQRDGKPKNFLNIQFDNKRLKIDQIVARIFYRYYDGGGLGSADDKNLEDMYQSEANSDEVEKITEKVNKCLNFLLDISEVRKRYQTQGLNQKEFSLFTRIWMYMEEEYGSFKINDIDEFYCAIAKALQPFTLPLDRQPKELQQTSPFDSNKTRGQQFKDTLGEHRSKEVIFETLMWMLNRVNMLDLVTLKDPQRLFPRDWREAKLIEQDFKCAVSGEKLTMKTAQGGHIVAHSEGGKTTYENLAMISADHNSKMGSMSIDQYKELL